MTSRTATPSSERGAVLVHTAFALLALVAFTTFVVDYGTLWLSRRQAQNAADAGALAGALALAFDDPTDFSDTGLGKLTAREVATQNLVYGQPPDVQPPTDITIQCPSCATQCPNGSPHTCIRVDVYRNQARNNPLPIFFGTLVGLSQQGIRATATAEILGANSVRCMLPFALADRWADNTDYLVDDTTWPGDSGTGTAGWTPNDAFEDATTTPSGTDSYTAPYVNPHTGWTVAGDYGRQIIVHAVGNQFSAGWANIVNLPTSVGNADTRWDIANCNQTHVGIADQNDDCSGYTPGGTTVTQALAGCLGVQTGWSQGPVQQGVSTGGGGVTSLMDQDQSATWSWAVNAGPTGQAGGVVTGPGSTTLNMSSPRIRPIAVFDITHYMNNSGCPNGGGSGCTVKVVNIIGIFVEGVCSDLAASGGLDQGMNCFTGPGTHPDSQVVGRIVTIPGSLVYGVGNPVPNSSFVQVVRLIR